MDIGIKNRHSPDRFMTVDVEEWFNILDIPGEIPFKDWGKQENRLEHNLQRLLELFRQYNVQATCFWLGYFAEKYPDLVRDCVANGHEIASHGYAHILAYQVGEEKFRDDIVRGKKTIEDIIQKSVIGFRAAGFSTTNDTPWFFDEIRRAGYLYDSSVFPASRGHGGMPSAKMDPYTIDTPHGQLVEFPQSVLSILGRRVSFFGGGYLRVMPYCVIKWGIKKLHGLHRPLIVYIHPREIDPSHPRLSMSLWRNFKSYNNLNSTYPKIKKLCSEFKFTALRNAVIDPDM